MADSTAGTTGPQLLYQAIGAGNLRAFVPGQDDRAARGCPTDMDVARFVVDHPDGIIVDDGRQRHHYPQGTTVAFTTYGGIYQTVRDRLRPEDGRDQPGRAAVVLDRAAQRLGGHAAGLNG